MLTVIQTLPALNSGGVERGTLDVAAELVQKGHRAVVISAGGQMVSELLDSGAEHIQLDIGRKSLTGLRHVKRLSEIFSSHENSIVHSRSRFPAWLSYLAWNSLRKNQSLTTPSFVTSVHGPYSVNAYSKIMLRGERVIAISDFIRDYIQGNYPGMDMGRVNVIPRGIDPRRFPYAHRPTPAWLEQWKEELPPGDPEFVVTLPARVTRWKGQQDFILTVDRIRQAGIRVLGIIAGGVEARRQGFQKELEALVEQRDLRQNIFFCGQRKDLREVMSASDLVFSLSREPEAFGRTSLEALALGVPVVAYDHGGASEVLSAMFPEGLVPALDVELAASRAIEFYRNRPRVADTRPFTLQRMLDSTIAIYTSLRGQ